LAVIFEKCLAATLLNYLSNGELCRILGDGADQAAWLSVGVMTSMPSKNLTPAITFGK
jgi:hypothetical protein